MSKILILFLFLGGCASTPCELSIQNIRVPYIPKDIDIQIFKEGIFANDNGHLLLKNHVDMINQLKAIESDCRLER